jgi:nicotinamide riboside kinase
MCDDPSICYQHPGRLTGIICLLTVRYSYCFDSHRQWSVSSTGRSQKWRKLENMRRVVIIGRGASGKSTLAVRLGEITGLPVIELDKFFWRPGLVATPRDQVAVQEGFLAEEGWIIDGDLGPYDVVEVRLRAADTILFLDFSLLRCSWQAIRRSRERAGFWCWLLAYRWQSRPILMHAIANHAVKADLRILRNPKALTRFVAGVAYATRSG